MHTVFMESIIDLKEDPQPFENLIGHMNLVIAKQYAHAPAQKRLGVLPYQAWRGLLANWEFVGWSMCEQFCNIV